MPCTGNPNFAIGEGGLHQLKQPLADQTTRYCTNCRGVVVLIVSSTSLFLVWMKEEMVIAMMVHPQRKLTQLTATSADGGGQKRS